MPGCATVLPIPFVLGGLLALAFAAPEAAEGRWTTALVFGLLGLVFSGIGAGMHFGFRQQAARAKRLAERQQLFPEEPWRWREDWADGPITDTMRQQMIASWFVAILWNAIALPSTVLGIREALRTGEPALWFVTIFGLVGLGLLVSAILQTMRYRRFGVSALELETFPGFLGGTLAGRIRASLDLHEVPRIPIMLRCIRQVVTGTGKHRSTREEVLWEDQIDVVRTFREGASTLIHFTFRLPAGGMPSAPLPATDQVIWRLEAHAEVPGVDYHAIFEVPVFPPPTGAMLPSDDLPIAVGFDAPPGAHFIFRPQSTEADNALPSERFQFDRPGQSVHRWRDLDRIPHTAVGTDCEFQHVPSMEMHEFILGSVHGKVQIRPAGRAADEVQLSGLLLLCSRIGVPRPARDPSEPFGWIGLDLSSIEVYRRTCCVEPVAAIIRDLRNGCAGTA